MNASLKAAPEIRAWLERHQLPEAIAVLGSLDEIGLVDDEGVEDCEPGVRCQHCGQVAGEENELKHARSCLVLRIHELAAHADAHVDLLPSVIEVLDRVDRWVGSEWAKCWFCGQSVAAHSPECPVPAARELVADYEREGGSW